MKVTQNGQRRRAPLPVGLVSAYNMTPIALFSLLVFSLSQGVVCSPPVDYLIYTSQLATAIPEAQKVDSLLPSLESIYSPDSTSPDSEQLKTNPHLLKLAERVQKIVGNLSHSHDNDLVDLETTRYAWHLMEKQAKLYMRNRVHTLKPFFLKLVEESEASSSCQDAISTWLDHLVNLEQWATLMWNSWGEFPPAGIFEGSFTDLGSYRSCINVPDNEHIGQAQYCTLDMQPLVPSRPRFHSIFKKVLDHDPHAEQLIAGDIPADNLNSRFSAHIFGSAKFQANKTLAGPGYQAYKYNKRTIVHNGTEETLLNPQETFSDSNATLKAEVSFKPKQRKFVVRFEGSERLTICFFALPVGAHRARS